MPGAASSFPLPHEKQPCSRISGSAKNQRLRTLSLLYVASLSLPYALVAITAGAPTGYKFSGGARTCTWQQCEYSGGSPERSMAHCLRAGRCWICRRPHFIGETPRGCRASLCGAPQEKGHLCCAPKYSSCALEGMVVSEKFPTPLDPACQYFTVANIHVNNECAKRRSVCIALLLLDPRIMPQAWRCVLDRRLQQDKGVTPAAILAQAICCSNVHSRSRAFGSFILSKCLQPNFVAFPLVHMACVDDGSSVPISHLLYQPLRILVLPMVRALISTEWAFTHNDA